ncbi:hypothetical protein [Paenibacillus faecalis]|uniref:hypothetical protein n=1 Tax=Paenibacillus faecalis TaxID=2079532 RepID=UPI000D104579|nr:hypothetical protein [Paenibacillus faecalis]
MKCKYCGTLVSKSPSRFEGDDLHDEELTPFPDNTAMALIVISTIIIPFFGLIVGGVISFSDDGHKRDTGKA